jgi:hypothetical protein
MRCDIRLNDAAAAPRTWSAAQASLPQPALGIMSIWIRLVGLRRKNAD